MFPPEPDQIRAVMIVSSAFLVTLFPSGAAAQDTTLLKDDRSPGKRKEGPGCRGFGTRPLVYTPMRKDPAQTSCFGFLLVGS